MLTKKNLNLIMEIAWNHFNKKGFEIGEGESQLCVTIMERNREHYPNDTPRVFMKKCLSELIATIETAIAKQLREQKAQQAHKDLGGAIQRRADAPDYPNNLPGNNGDVGDRLKQMEQERGGNQSQKTDRSPNQFQQKLDEDNSQVGSSYEDIQRARQQEEQTRVEIVSRNGGQQPRLAAPEQTQLGKPIPEQLIPIQEEQKQQFEAGPAPVNFTTAPQQQAQGVASHAPMSEGQRLLIEKPKALKRLEGDSYKYNNNMLKSFNLIINSQDRNTSAYPNNSNYQIDLDVIYKDIISVELISAIVPKTQYLINGSNNIIYFDEGAGEISATVAVGNYTPTTLGTALGNAMTTAGGQTYTATADETLTNKYTISAAGGFSLIFVGDTVTYNETTRTNYKTNSIGPIIGFPKTDLASNTTHTGTNQFNLNGDTYLLLHIQDFDNLFGVHNESVTKSFAKIVLDTNQSEYKFFKSQSDYITRKEFSPMMAKLSQLNIRFLNYSGSEYDFGGLEHTLCFKITTMNQSQGYYF